MLRINSSYPVIRIEGHLTSYNMIWNFRYSVGFTKNADETVKTSASMIVGGVIKIIISAVSAASG